MSNNGTLLGFAIAVLVLTPPVVAQPAPSVPISFTAPAQANGFVETAGFQWVLLYLSAADLSLASIQSGEVINKTFSVATVHVPEVGTYDVPGGWQPAQAMRLPKLFSANLSFGSRAAALFIEAESIAWSGGPFRGQLVPLEANDDAESPLAGGSNSVAMHARPVASGVGIGFRTPSGSGGVHLHAEGIRRVEWFGATISCSEARCPEGGGEWNETVLTPRGDRAAATRLSWMDLSSQGGKMELIGTAWAISAGGLSLNLRVDGDVRLPSAGNLDLCPHCPVWKDGTLALRGNISFTELSPLEHDRMRARLSGHALSARLDESSIDPSLLGLGLAPAALAGVAAVAVAWKLLALFSRALRDPLANARRREVYDAIRANPGLAFRDLLRLTGMANGVASHHVRALVQHGLIVRHAVGNTVRLFENHGRYDQDWRTVAALRDPDARLLHAWLKARGRCRQLDALEAAADWGWTPSKAKRRLEALVEAGLAATAREGRVRWYAVPSAGNAPAPVG